MHDVEGTTAAKADSRDMVGAHDMFRRQFGALPGLVRSAPAGDAERARAIGDHVKLLAALLHGHHASEDEHVWPKLHERCPQETQRLVDTMQAQHEMIDSGLQGLVTEAEHWSVSADTTDQKALADTAEQLNPALREHLALEEAEVLQLIDGYLSEEEWKATVAASAAGLAPETAPLTLGMLLSSADETMRDILLGGMPADFRQQMEPMALDAYDSYAENIYGDARP